MIIYPSIDTYCMFLNPLNARSNGRHKNEGDIVPGLWELSYSLMIDHRQRVLVKGTAKCNWLLDEGLMNSAWRQNFPVELICEQALMMHKIQPYRVSAGQGGNKPRGEGQEHRI